MKISIVFIALTCNVYSSDNVFFKWKSFIKENNVDISELKKFLLQYPDCPRSQKLFSKLEERLNPGDPWFKNNYPKTVSKTLEWLSYIKDTNGGFDSEQVKFIKKFWRSRTDLTIVEQSRFFFLTKRELNDDDNLIRINSLVSNKSNDLISGMMSLLKTKIKSVADASYFCIAGNRSCQELIKSIKEYPIHKYLLVNYYKKQKNHNQAIEFLLKNKSNGNLIGDLVLFYARYLLERKSPEKALKILNNFENNIIGDTWARVIFLKGWIQFSFLKKYDKALDNFKEFYGKSKQSFSKSKASFWYAKACKKNREDSSAIEFYKKAASYPSTFYGQRAIFELKNVNDSSIKKSFKNSEPEKDIWQKVFMSIPSGEIKQYVLPFAAKAASSVRSQADGDVLIKHAYNRFGRIIASWMSFYLSKYYSPTIKEAFPILDFCNFNDLNNKSLIHAIVRQESMFDPEVVSSAGAVGLVQIMPGTADIERKKINNCYYKSLSDPSYNLMLGCEHVKGLLNYFNGNKILVICAYNAGKRAVEEWTRDFGVPKYDLNNQKTLDWIELIPYKETREYVQRVLSNLKMYENLYK